jgi:hypothetical protein
MNTDVSLWSEEEEFGLESLPEGSALGCTFCSSTVSTASCPGSSAATLMCASTLG